MPDLALLLLEKIQVEKMLAKLAQNQIEFYC